MGFALLTFSIAAVLIVLLPGPDTLVVVRSLVRGGRRAAFATTVGVLCGLTVWATAAALGLSALLRASEVGYDVLRLAGAAYLIWLGIASLRSRGAGAGLPGADSGVAAGPGADSHRPTSARAPRELFGGGFGAGLLTDLLNPKVGVFFVTFLPGFLPHGYPIGAVSLLFGAIFVVLTAGYFAVLLALAGRVTGWMTTPRIRRRLDAVTGTVLVGLGVRLALQP